MRMQTISLLTLMVGAGLGAALRADAQSLSGTYAVPDAPAVRLVITESSDGSIAGSLTGNGVELALRATRAPDGFRGVLDPEGEAVPLAGAANGDLLIVAIGAGIEAQSVLFARVGPAGAAGPAPVPGGTDETIVNGARLSADDLARLAAAYGIRVPPGDYWYDAVLGAWGLHGGPTMGFIAPGLDFGGPLAADASGRGTGIFVNGRELHVNDVIALQQVTGPILQGRYFITAQGLAGFEGGPPLWNLAALGAQSQDNPTNTWQSRITGASGFSDGTTGAVFLPNGGIVSTGN